MNTNIDYTTNITLFEGTEFETKIKQWRDYDNREVVLIDDKMTYHKYYQEELNESHKLEALYRFLRIKYHTEQGLSLEESVLLVDDELGNIYSSNVPTN